MFLIEKFQQFHAEVVRLEARVTGGVWVFPGEEPAPPGDSAAKESPSGVWRRLSSLLERQSQEAASSGGDFGVELYRRAQYAMAAYADEIFLHTDWAGRERWRENLLEEKFFETHRAGEELFDRIDQLLREGESLYAELGRIYLMVLGLGFQGKYRGEPNVEETIAGYRRRLFHFVFNRDPLAVRGQQDVVPEAYESTLDAAVSTELPYLRPWFWAIAASLMLWIGGSWAIWRYSKSTLQVIVDRITEADELERKNEEREATPDEADATTTETAPESTTSTPSPGESDAGESDVEESDSEEGR